MCGSDYAAVLSSERVAAVTREGILNKCQAAEILKDSWFVTQLDFSDSILFRGTLL